MTNFMLMERLFMGMLVALGVWYMSKGVAFGSDGKVTTGAAIIVISIALLGWPRNARSKKSKAVEPESEE